MKRKPGGALRRLRSLVDKGLKVDAPQIMDGLSMMAVMPDNCAAAVFMDPQYRTGLDKLKFGNEGSRQKARYKLPQMTDSDIRWFVDEADRILQPSRHLFLWLDKFSIGSGTHLRYLRGTKLQVVDLFAWNKLSIGMGRRGRCVTEYLIICQKPPIRAKGVWTDHRIPDCWAEGKDQQHHPHAKPHQLTERLIRASTRRGDLVVDPCAGGYGVLTACRLSGRHFIGCDRLPAPEHVDAA